MTGLFQTIKRLLTYKGPGNNEGFELLEGEYEGADRKIEQETSGQKKGNEDKKPSKGKKTPKTIDEWNKAKNEENKNQQQFTGEIVTKELKTNLERMKREFNVPQNRDVVVREFKVARKINAFIVYIDGMADKVTINNYILRQLMTPGHFNDFKEDCAMDYIAGCVLSINQVMKLKEYEKIILQVLCGVTALFIDGCEESLLIESRGYEKRNVDKPSTENVIRGPQEAFTENLRTNLTLVRRIIKNKNLITELIPVGKTNNSNCGIMYIEGITNPEVIKEVKRRIKSINTDFIGGTGMLDQFIEDNPYMILPQTLTTERPDRTASFLMEGKVVIIVDGTPFAITVPITFFHLFHSSEDSFLRWQYGTFLRLIRVVGLFVAILLPGLYIALTLYHQEMIPTALLVAIAKSRENVPFPTVVELLMMEIAFDLIREGGERIPGVIGNTLGIVGALILGQAAVAANIVSPILVIIVAITALGNFSIPSYTLAFGVRIIRFAFIFSGAIAGFYGISAGIFILGGMACSMKSFGVPYFSPVAPKTKVNPDTIIRGPIFKQTQRPDAVNPLDRKRAGDTPGGWSDKSPGGGNR